MIQLNLPAFRYKVKKQADKLYIYDAIRRKYLQLTPEEWVRQHFIHYLIDHLKYPRGLITTESGLKYNQLQRRTDIVVFNREARPFMIVECKAPTVAINQQVFNQIAVYNKVLEAQLLVVSNGVHHYCCRFQPQSQRWEFLPQIPGCSL
jgi:hypothetical protein